MIQIRECNEYEITIEKLMNVVHNYTDPIKISVIIGDSWISCEEAKNMHNFTLTNCWSYRDESEQARLLKYYKDVPVWNLTVWTGHDYSSPKGRAFHMGIEAHCYYKDIREGYLAEKADKKREKQREYRKRRKLRGDSDE